MSGIGDLLSDLAHPLRSVHHPGRFLEDLPGGHFAETLIGKTSWDLINAVTNSPGGLMYLATQGTRHPIRVGTQMIDSTIQDFRHPLRHPGYTLLDLMGVEGAVGGTIGRVGAIGVAARRGALAGQGAEGTAARLAEAAEAGIIPKHLISEETAKTAGAGQDYSRLVNPDTGAINTPGRQMSDAILFGPAREERLLWPKGVESLDTPDGLAQHGWWYSKDPIIKAAQKLVDKAYDTFPDSNIAPIWKIATEGPIGLRSQSRRISSAIRAERLGVDKEIRSKGTALVAKHSALMNPVNWMVLRLIGEGTDPMKLIHFHQLQLDGGDLVPRMVAETKQRIETIKAAAEYVQPKEIPSLDGSRVRVVNELKPEHVADLQEFIDDFRGLSNERTHVSMLAGVLSSEDAAGRAAGPHALVETGKLMKTLSRMQNELVQVERLIDPKQQARAADLRKQIAEYKGQLNLDLDHEIGPETEGLAMKDYFDGDADIKDFVDKGGLFRVPYTLPKLGLTREGIRNRKAYRATSSPSIPGSYTHQFKAGLLKHGGGEVNTARLMAESYTEAHRFLSLKKVWGRLQALAVDNPANIPEQYRRLIKVDPAYAPGAKPLTLSKVERSILTQEGNLGATEAVAAGRLFEGIRNYFFPDKSAKASDLGLTDEQFKGLMGKDRAFEAADPVTGTPYGYKWIDSRHLGDLDKRNPLIGLYDYGIATKALHFTDKVNQAVKSAMLFLRPAYAAPNMFGNIALNLIQQGMLAPVHMGLNLKLYMGLSEQERKLVPMQMGETSELAQFRAPDTISGKLGSWTQKGSEGLANFYSQFVDKPFRINAWMHEARRAGYQTPGEIKKLLTDPTLEDARRNISNTATEEIVNYERMGPGEEAFLRRLILFYPFTRGASRYTLNFPKEHPLATGAVGVLGEKGFERSEELLGPLPVWAEGLIPLEGLGIPFTHKGEVSNPAAFSIMGEPAHLFAQALNLISAHPIADYAFSQNLTPVDQGLLSVVTGGASSRFAKPGSPLAKIFEQDAFGGIPAVSLMHRLQGKSSIGGPLSSSVYPDDTLWHSLSQFALLGSLTPRDMNTRLANYKRYQENPLNYPKEAV